MDMTREQRIKSTLVLLLFISPFFMAISDSSVWDANEAFYVQTPREMIESGDWIVPEFNGKPRLNKPPLSYWLIAVFYDLFGVSLLWERLLMALLAGVSIVSTFHIGKKLYDPDTALLGAGIFATSFRFLVVSRRLMIDSLVLCCVLVGIALFLHWLESRRQWVSVASAFFFGLAFLAKGPVGLFPFLFLGMYCLFPENRWCLREAPWKISGLVFLLVASSWFLVLGFHHGWDPVIGFFVSENIGRFAGEEFGPRRGLLYYLGVFLGDFFPWSLPFLAVALSKAIGLVGRVRSSNSFLSVFKSCPASDFLLAAWFLTYFLVFSFSQNKQEYYILPVYPAAGILLARALSKSSALLKPAFVFSGTVFLALFPLLWFINRELFWENEIPWWIPGIAALLCGICLIKRQILLSILSLVFFYQASFFVFSTPLEDYKPVASLAKVIQSSARTSEYQTGYYRYTAPSLRFYVDRDIHELFDLDEAIDIWSEAEDIFLITDQNGLDELEESLGDELVVLERRSRFSSRLSTLISRLKDETSREEAWTRPVYLVAKPPPGDQD